MPPRTMLLQTLTPAICLTLEKGLLSPTPTNQECCAVIQHCSLSFLKEKKRNQISSLLYVLQLFKWKTLLQIFLQSFSVLFLLCFQITFTWAFTWETQEEENIEKLLICQVENSTFHFQNFFFQLEKQHIIYSVKFWNHKIVLEQEQSQRQFVLWIYFEACTSIVYHVYMYKSVVNTILGLVHKTDYNQKRKNC